MLRVDILQEKVDSLNRDMMALENSYSVPVEELADNIRNYIVVPLLRMAQSPKGLGIKRDEYMLKIDGFIEDTKI